jgi:DNA repair ATPase RecN
MHFTNNQASQSLHQCEQMIQQLVNQTQQASHNYQMLLQQEQQNAQRLEELASREQKAAQIIQTALQGHQTAIQQLHQVSQICKQVENMIHSQYNSPLSQSHTLAPDINPGFAAHSYTSYNNSHNEGIHSPYRSM